MTRIVYVNGRYLRYRAAQVHAEDRGFQLADAVYEVIEVRGGQLVDETRHLARLSRSLGELGIREPMSRRALGLVLRQTMLRNRIENGLVYLQVTRGAAPRDFLFPSPPVRPTVVCLARRLDPARLEARAAAGIAVKTMPDFRWARSDIKTVMLLPACLAKEAARAAGADEAWFVDRQGFVTEGASSNAWILDARDRLVTHPRETTILAGVARATVIDVLAEAGVDLIERPFRVAEALAAREAFITSASATVMPVVKIDGTAIGDGRPGRVTQLLRSRFHQVAEISSR
ncbi:MAG TPA: D-amino-acid transaminase [Hyphomicrobiaceae bacterium]|nr:D-amino-acid transaminase [Hyphomicrobiaceae bacterium]